MVWTKYVWMASRWWVFYVRDYPRCMWVSSINICIVGIIRELILSQYQPSLWWLPRLCKENRILKTDGPRREEFLLLVEFVQGVVVGRGTIQSWWVGTLCKPSKPMKGKIRHGIWMANNLNRVVMILDQFWSYDYLRASCIITLQNEVIRFAWQHPGSIYGVFQLHQLLIPSFFLPCRTRHHLLSSSVMWSWHSHLKTISEGNLSDFTCSKGIQRIDDCQSVPLRLWYQRIDEPRCTEAAFHASTVSADKGLLPEDARGVSECRTSGVSKGW